MGFLAIAKVAVLLTVAGLPDAPAAAQPPKLPAPITTRQNFFAIPFHLQRADAPQQEAVEVQLYVSGDQGKTWQLYSKTDPTERQFLFRCACDGEFWFIVRTLDRSGRVRPAEVKGPEMRVVVDTVPPALSLEAKLGQGGQVTANWKVEEANPKLDTLSIQYRSSSIEPWQTVAIDRRDGVAEGPVHSGQATWLPAVTGGSIEIRAEITDAAGNSAVSHAQLQLAQTTNDPAVPADSIAPERPETEKPPVAGMTAAKDPQPADTSKTAETASPPPAGNPFVFSAMPPANPPVLPQDALAAAGVNAPYQNQYQPPREDRPGNSAGNPIPGRDWPYWVNKKLFDLNYDVTSVGPSGLGRVEVWGTRDAGRSWKCLAVDNDNVSPISVGVDAEGVYGFRVVMQSRAGAGGEPPKSGDMPELWIGADWTPPVVKLLATQQGSGPDCGTLTIAWQATDQNMAAQPISLFWSEQANGPWTSIAANLDNTGSFVWKLPQQVTTQVFLHIEARDMAGNMGLAQSSEPIHLNPMRASAQARAVPPPYLPTATPVEASRTEPKRFYFK